MTKNTNQRNNSSSATHQSVQKSSTLNRKYVSRPTIHIEICDIQTTADEPISSAALAEEPIPVEVDEPTIVPDEPLRSILQDTPNTHIIERSDQVNVSLAFSEADEDVLAEESSVKNTSSTIKIPVETPDLPPEVHPYQKIFSEISAQKQEEEIIPPPTPRELKNEAIKTALNQLKEQKEEQAFSEVIATEKKTNILSSRLKKSQKTTKRTLSDSFKKKKRHSSFGKFFLAFATSAACIGILGYFVSLNMPSISVRVAAMQTGIEASYPTYIPRDYQLSGVSTGDDNSVTISFSGKDNAAFHISEEKSSWDSNALLNNYVKNTWGEDYTTIREQGITLYVHNSDAAWVNGGILYKLTNTSGSLSKKLIKNIALSL